MAVILSTTDCAVEVMGVEPVSVTCRVMEPPAEGELSVWLAAGREEQ